MKILLILILFFQHDQMTIEQVRSLFYSATENNKNAEIFQKKLKAVDSSTPVLLGYKGMAELVMAKHSYNPVSKFSYFKKGKDLLEKAIESNPENPELRYLRVSIQTNAPSFLNYNKNIEEDKGMILRYLMNGAQEDHDLEQRMKAFISESRYFSEKEKELIRYETLKGK